MQAIKNYIIHKVNAKKKQINYVNIVMQLSHLLIISFTYAGHAKFALLNYFANLAIIQLVSLNHLFIFFCHQKRNKQIDYLVHFGR